MVDNTAINFMIRFANALRFATEQASFTGNDIAAFLADAFDADWNE